MYTKLKQKQLQPPFARRKSPENLKKVYTTSANSIGFIRLINN
jgi:hypothetical protein